MSQCYKTICSILSWCNSPTTPLSIQTLIKSHSITQRHSLVHLTIFSIIPLSPGWIISKDWYEWHSFQSVKLTKTNTDRRQLLIWTISSFLKRQYVTTMLFVNHVIYKQNNLFEHLHTPPQSLRPHMTLMFVNKM